MAPTSLVTVQAATSAARLPAATPTTGVIGGSAAAKAATTVRWFSYFNPQDIKRLGSDFLPSYEQDHPGVAIEALLAPGGIIDAEQKYLAMASAGDPPDLYGITRPATTLAQQGLYANLSPLIQRDKFDTAKYNQQLFQYQANYQGNAYGLPLSVHAEAPAMIYNRDLFKAAGVPEPPTAWGDPAWTWDTFVAAARRLTVAAGEGTVSQAGVDSLAYNVHLPVLWEGTWVSSKLDHATCDASAMIDTYAGYFELQLKDKVMPGATLKGPPGGFRGGKVAMSTMGSWEFGVYQKLATVDWAFMPFPKATRSAYAFDPNMGYIAKTSKQVDAAWTFLKWLDNGSHYALYFNFMPMIARDTSGWTKSFFANKPDVRPQVLAASLQVAQPTDPIFLLPGSDAFIAQTIEPALTAVGAGKAEVTATLRAIKGPLQQLIDQAKR